MRKIILAVVVAAGCGSPYGTPPQAVDVDAIVKLCVTESSCLSTGTFNASDCVTKIETELAASPGGLANPVGPLLEHEVQCAAQGRDCTSTLTCATDNHGPAWCKAHPFVSCDGNVIIGCDGDWGLARIDCGAMGMQCVATLNAAACSDGKSCTEGTPDRCDGDRLVQCGNGGHESSIDCGALLPGGSCVVKTSGGKTSGMCLPPRDSACPSSGDTLVCDGKVLVTCSDGHGARLDCAQLASHCGPLPGGSFGCVPDATECDPTTAADRCAGADLQVCANGKWKTVACSSLGLSKCTPTQTGAKCS